MALAACMSKSIEFGFDFLMDFDEDDVEDDEDEADRFVLVWGSPDCDL